MKDALERVGLPFRKVECYGSQIMVTAVARDTAAKWLSILQKICKTHPPRMVESVDYCGEATQANRKTLAPKMIQVWRVGGTI